MPARQLTVLRANLSAILAGVKAKIVEATGIPAARVRVLARETQGVPRFNADQDVLLRFRGFTSDPNHRGRYDRRLKHRLEVTIRTRFGEFDEAGEDTRWLTDSVGGNVVAWEAVLDCLEEYHPRDGTGNHLTIEGLHILEGDDGKTDPREGGWGETRLFFGVSVEAKLTQSGPAWLRDVG